MRVHHVPLAAVFLVVLSGCASHVEWMPDSKSFLYSHRDGRVLRYDLATRQTTRLTRIDLGDEKGWPVFSLGPDGKRVAVAESFTAGDDTRLVTTELRLLDLEGKALQTRTLSWPAEKDSASVRKAVPAHVQWSPKGGHVLLGTDSAVAVYDVAAERFAVHEDVAAVLPVYFGASPWRPDGKGFLAAGRHPEKRAEILFVTTDGEVQKLDVGELPEPTKFKRWPTGHWEGPVLVTTHDSRELRLDTKTLRVTHRTVVPEGQRTWALGSSRLILRQNGDQAEDDGTELVWTDGPREVVVVRDFGPAFTQPSGPVVPSPDGRWAVVIGKRELTLVAESGIVDRILVASAEGNEKQ